MLKEVYRTIHHTFISFAALLSLSCSSSSDSSSLKNYHQNHSRAALISAESQVLTPPPDAAVSLFGFSIAAGDIQNDGLADLVVGAPNHVSKRETKIRAGQAYAFAGTSSGLESIPFWTQPGRPERTGFGYAVAATNIYGDSYDDIIVGEPYCGEGQVHLFSATEKSVERRETWDSCTGKESKSAEGSRRGFSLASAGDINDNGYEDYVVGAPAQEDCGTVLAAGITTSASPGTWWDVTSMETCSEDFPCRDFGAAVAAGDFNQDDFYDLAVGSPRCDVDAVWEGCAFVYHGGSSPDDYIDWFADPTNEEHAFFGRALASGDVNGDGFSDLAVSAVHSLYLYHGRKRELPEDPSQILTLAEAGPSFGAALSFGDVDADGFEDMVVGAPRWGKAPLGEGKAYLFLGRNEGVDTEPAWSADPVDQSRAGFGSSIVLGDVNADGRADIIVGTPYWNDEQPDRGRVDIFLATATPLPDAGIAGAGIADAGTASIDLIVDAGNALQDSTIGQDSNVDGKNARYDASAEGRPDLFSSSLDLMISALDAPAAGQQDMSDAQANTHQNNEQDSYAAPGSGCRCSLPGHKQEEGGWYAALLALLLARRRTWH